MSDKKSWLSRFTFGKKIDAEARALQEKFDLVVGELKDQTSYDVKSMELDSAGAMSPYHSEMHGIEQQVDNAALQRIYSTETWVYIAVTAIAKTIAGLPFRLEQRKVVSKEVVNEQTGQKETINTEIWIDASGEKLFRRFQYPNRFTTKSEFLMLLVIDLLTTGEYFVYLDSDSDLSALEAHEDEDDSPNSPFARLRNEIAKNTPVKAMYRCPPALIKPVVSKDRAQIDGYAVQTEGGAFGFAPAEIIHVKLPNPNDAFRGLSPLFASFKSVLLDRFSTEHMVRFYKSGARLGGVIETDKPLNKEQLGRFQRSFESNYTGRHNHHRVLILPPGMKYNQTEQNPAETALLEFCRYNREAILSCYNVPPLKVGILDNANYANAYAQLKIFFTDTVMPYLTFIEDGFNLHAAMMPGDGMYRFKFDLSNVEALQEDLKEKAETAQYMLKAGLTTNEVREMVWKARPLPDGDKAQSIEFLKVPQGPSSVGTQAPMSTHAAPMSETKEAGPGPQPDLALLDSTKPTEMTFSARVAQLVALYVQQGYSVPQATEVAIEKARAEGFTEDTPLDPSKPAAQADSANPAEVKPQDEDEKDLTTGDQSALIPTEMPGKPKKPKKEELKEFIASALAQLKDGEEVTPEFLTELAKLFEETHPSEAAIESKEIQADSAPTQGEIQTTTQASSFGFTKEHRVQYWKSFISKTDPLIEKRHGEVKKFFEKFSRIVKNNYSANLKAYGMHKARDKSDADEIVNESQIKDLVNEYVSNADDSLLEAFASGYDMTLDATKFNLPSEKAIAYLKQYAGQYIEGIVDTTIDELKSLLTDAFTENVGLAEISKRITEKFTEIGTGRAATIARTESLTAVSMGQEQKRQDYKDAFPEAKLVKMWATAEDDRVRDSHEALDGVTVGIDETFDNGLKFPRDPDGEASEVINCRCTDITMDANDEGGNRETLQGDDSSDADTTDEEVSSEDDGEKSTEASASKDICATGEHKGGPGSGCRGSSCGRPRGSGDAKPRAPKEPKKPAAEAKPTEAPKPAAAQSTDVSTVVRDHLTDSNSSRDITALLTGGEAQFEAIKQSDPGLTTAVKDWTRAGYIYARAVQKGRNVTAGGSKIKPDELALGTSIVKGLDAGFEKLPKYEGPIARDLNIDADAAVKMFKEGGSFTTDAYTSFTAEESYNDSRQVRIIVDKSTAGRAIWGLSTLENEGEVLVPKGTKYKIAKIEHSDDRPNVIIHMTEVGAKDIALDDSAISDLFDGPLFDRDAEKCAAGIHTKGGPGSGCHGPNCGRPSGPAGEGSSGRATSYDRPKQKPIADAKLTGGKRNNFQNSEHSGDPALMDKKGKDVTVIDTRKFQRIAEDERMTNFKPQLNLFEADLKREGVDVVSVKSRAKDAGSLLDKMNGKWSDIALNQVTDGIGGRVVVTNMLELDKAVARYARLVPSSERLEHTDYAENPKDGYRAVHVLVRTPGGMIAEMQFKTQNQDTWANWSHDDLYKNPDMKGNKEANDYAKSVSDYLYQTDLGKTPPGERPQAPQIVKDKGLEFPWGKVSEKPFKA